MKILQRKIIEQLQHWRQRAGHKPLLLHGARQVGKTYAALAFGKVYYKNTVYLNFEGNPELVRIFAGNLAPARLVQEIEAYLGQTILPHDTLLVFDEVQACERALTSLKYFCEEAPEYDILAVGSLLGVALHREHYSFPVGKVDMLQLYPLDFEEFLWAIGETRMAQAIREAYNRMEAFALHERALALYRLYLVVGGMPQVVQTYAETRDFNLVQSTQKNLEHAYVADMAKYATPQETARIMAVWDSLPAQLAKENSKFQYKLVKSGARAHQYAMALDWLQAAGLVNRCTCTTEGRLPLAAFAKSDTFKLYLVDTGLLCAKFGIPAQIVLHAPHSFDAFKGALTENYVMQVLTVNGLRPYYWTSKGTAEVDFVYQDAQGRIVPVEVKAAQHVRAKSLHQFCQTYAITHAIRISARNFGAEGDIISLPLYAAFCLHDGTSSGQ